ncbi:MAG: DUF535 family protein [Methylotenera sp.]
MTFKNYIFLWDLSGDLFYKKFGISILRFKFMIMAFFLSREVGLLLQYRKNVAVKNLILERPETLGAIIWPYQCNTWDAKTRLSHIAEHYNAIEDLKFKIAFPLDGALKLLDLTNVYKGLHIVLDQPKWFMREGQLVINLFLDKTRILSLAFSFARESGKVVAYIGAIQGRNFDWSLDLNRDLTKAMHGMRPRDFLFEQFRTLCRTVGVSKIYAVSNASRHHLDSYFGKKNEKRELALNYDEVWIERGGILEDSDFYVFSMNLQKKNIQQIPAKKRSMYRRRYEFLETTEVRTQEVCVHLDSDKLLEYPFSSL